VRSAVIVPDVAARIDLHQVRAGAADEAIVNQVRQIGGGDFARREVAPEFIELARERARHSRLVRVEGLGIRGEPRDRSGQQRIGRCKLARGILIARATELEPQRLQLREQSGGIIPMRERLDCNTLDRRTQARQRRALGRLIVGDIGRDRLGVRNFGQLLKGRCAPLGLSLVGCQRHREP